MKILMAASEGTPYAKTGGLADVMGALPAALADRGEEVAVVLPLYRSAQALAAPAERVFDRMPIWLTKERSYQASIRRLAGNGVQTYFVDCPELYDRPALYGEEADYPDNAIRFAVFARAVLGVARALFRPDILHCHDWQSSLIGPMMRHQFRMDPTFLDIKTVLTIHNLGYQGVFPRSTLDDIGLSRDLFRTDALEFWGGINFLKGGLVFADAITTVSKGYAREILTREYGFGLEGLLQTKAPVLSGILNGVDYGEWSPETDSYIAARYSMQDLSGKRLCKLDLLKEFDLPYDRLDRPVIGMVSRFASQKGFDLVEEIAADLLFHDVLLTALGTGESRYETMMRGLAERFPDKVSVKIAYDDELAHKIEAGADMFLMPSRYEPCGLNQIYSLRYGTVPIVRATGGLDDTVDTDTGFKFEDYSGPALMAALDLALTAWKNPARWTALMKSGMKKDHSWGAAAGEYVDLYWSLLRV